MLDIHITMDDNEQLEIQLDGEASYTNFMTAMLATLDGQVQSFIETVQEDEEVDEETLSTLKASIYDELNFIFGQILERIIPTDSDDFEANLTTEAILRAENEIIEEKYNELKEAGEIE